jgi:hypothetical protein
MKRTESVKKKIETHEELLEEALGLHGEIKLYEKRLAKITERKSEVHPEAFRMVESEYRSRIAALRERLRPQRTKISAAIEELSRDLEELQSEQERIQIQVDALLLRRFAEEVTEEEMREQAAGFEEEREEVEAAIRQLEESIASYRKFLEDVPGDEPEQEPEADGGVEAAPAPEAKAAKPRKKAAKKAAAPPPAPEPEPKGPVDWVAALSGEGDEESARAVDTVLQDVEEPPPPPGVELESMPETLDEEDQVEPPAVEAEEPLVDEAVAVEAEPVTTAEVLDDDDLLEDEELDRYLDDLDEATPLIAEAEAESDETQAMDVAVEEAEEASTESRETVVESAPPTARFEVVAGDYKGKVFALDEEVVRIGRGADNQIRLSLDSRVSRNHARVERRGAGFVLVDNGSFNGSFVNGKRIREQALSEGDEILIGQTRMVFKLRALDCRFALP